MYTQFVLCFNVFCICGASLSTQDRYQDSPTCYGETVKLQFEAASFTSSFSLLWGMDKRSIKFSLCH